MRRLIGAAFLSVFAASPALAQGKPPIDYSILHAQVILDSLGFSPGIVDGREGQSLTAALKGFQESRSLPKTGKLDRATLGALHQYRERRPVTRGTLDPALTRVVL